MSDLYREVIIDHYKHPRNFRPLSDADAHGKEDNAVCGDSVEYFLAFDASGKTREVTWQGQGCALSQAAASLLSEQLVGKTREELAQVSDGDILKIVGEQLNPSRKKCATLCILALQNTLRT